MAVIRLGPTVGGISGKIGGLTFSSTKGGTICRNSPLKSLHPNSLQLTFQNRFERTHRAWENLTPEAKSSWNEAAVLFNFKNRLGLTRAISGLQLFFVNNLSWASSYIPSLSLPPLEGISSRPWNVTFSVSLPDDFIVSYETDIPSYERSMHFWFSRPYTSKPITHFPHWRLSLATGPAWSPINVKSFWLKCWDIPRVGERVAVGVAQVGLFKTFSKPVVAFCNVL